MRNTKKMKILNFVSLNTKTSTKISATALVALISIFLIAILLTRDALSWQANELSDKDLMDPAYTRKVLILPALKNIRLASSVSDPGLKSWLNLLELKVVPLSHIGPSAFATTDNGYPVVQIDMMFCSKCFLIADLAGLLMNNPNENVMFDIGKRYGQKLAESVLKG
jgi:hypothetical protein